MANLEVVGAQGDVLTVATLALSGGVEAVKHAVINGDGSVQGTQSSFSVGQKAVSSSAAALGSGALKNGVVVKARLDNTAPVWVGGSGVAVTDDGTGNGYRLDPGDAISFAVENLSAIYVIAAAAQVVYYVGN